MNKKYYFIIKILSILIITLYAGSCFLFYVAYGSRLNEIEVNVGDLSVATQCEQKLHEIVITLRMFLLGTFIILMLSITALVLSIFESRRGKK